MTDRYAHKPLLRCRKCGTWMIDAPTPGQVEPTNCCPQPECQAALERYRVALASGKLWPKNINGGDPL